MSGHSKWSTIKRAKGAADIKRGQTFTKVANVIAIAARAGGSGDPTANPRLRAALEEARSVNMPKDNIQRAIDRGLGNLPGQSIEEVSYEGFGPLVGGGRVAFFLEGVTDNRLRTNQEIKHIFESSGGSLGSTGSTIYMFDKRGELRIVSKGGNKEDEMLELIDLGADDVEDYTEEEDGKIIQKYLVYAQSTELNTMGTKITQAEYEIESKEIVYKPNTLQEITDEQTAKKVLGLAEVLEEHDDIQKVYANFNIPDNILEKMQGS